MNYELYQHDIKAAIIELANSPALGATLTWDGGNNYRVQPGTIYCVIDEGHREILTRDDLQSWCDGDLSADTVETAAQWVTENQTAWFNGEI